MAQKVGSSPGIKVDVDVPPVPFSTPLGTAHSAKIVSYLNGTPVIECDVELREKETILDENGVQVFRKDRKNNDLGGRHRYKTRRETIKFWLRRSPRGHVRIQQHFEEAPEERARLERVARVQTFQEKLAEAAVERGITPGQLVDQLFADQLSEVKKENGNDPDPEKELEFDGEWPKNRGALGWQISDGSYIKGEGAEMRAKIAQAKLGTSPPEKDE